MEYDLERVKSGARQRALLWQDTHFYSLPIQEGIITYEDLYHLGLFEEASSEVIRVTRNEQVLESERDKLVGIIQECGARQAYERWESIYDLLSRYHNEKLKT